MTDGNGNQKSLIGVVVVLVVALVVVFVLWQRDQDSKDINVDFNTGSAETVVESGPPLARGLPEGTGLSAG